MDLDVADGHGREAVAIRDPIAAAVRADEQPELAAGEEEVGIAGVLADGVEVAVVGEVAADRGPRLAEVHALEDIRPVIGDLMAGHGQVHTSLDVVRRLDAGHPVVVGGEALDVGGDVLPIRAAVTGDLDLAVVRADPDDAFLERRLRDGQDRAVVLGPGVVDGQTAGVLELGRVVGRQVRAGLGPGQAAVGGLEQVVAAEVEDEPVVRRDEDGRVPVEPVGRLGQRGLGPDALGFAGLEVVALDAAHLEVAVHDPPLDGVELGVVAVAAAGRHPVVVEDAGPLAGVRGAEPVAVVLEADVDVIGVAHVEADVVDLGPGLRGHSVGVDAAVPGDVDAAVVAADDVAGVLGVDPDRVMVGMGPAEDLLEALARVAADIAGAGIDVDDELVRRVDGQAAVVERPEVDLVVGRPVGGPPPGDALIFRAIEAAPVAFGLDEGVDDGRVAACDAESDAAPRGGRQAIGEGGPGVAAVGRLVEAAAGAAAPEVVGPAAVLPHPGVEDLGVRGVHGQVAGAGLGVDVKDLLPGLAAVPRAEDAAVVVGPPEMALGGDIDDVGIDGVDGDPADEAGVGEAHVLPGPAGVLGFVNAVAGGHGIARGRLAGAHPDDVGMALRHGHGADRDRLLQVERRRPGDAGIHGLPQAARAYGRVDDGRVRVGDGEVHDPSAHIGRADVADPKLVDDRRVVELGRLGCGLAGLAGGRSERDEKQGRDCRGHDPETKLAGHGNLLAGDGNRRKFTLLHGRYTIYYSPHISVMSRRSAAASASESEPRRAPKRCAQRKSALKTGRTRRPLRLSRTMLTMPSWMPFSMVQA